MTVDGKLTTKNYTAVDFTSREDKKHLIRQRALADAVLIGYGTLKKDNVRLGVPVPELREAREKRGQTPYPLRVVVSNEGRIDPALNIFNTDFSPVVIFSTKRMPRDVRAALEGKATLHLTNTPEVDLVLLLQHLKREYGVRSVACEGGAVLFRSLLEQGLVDQLNLTIAPFLFGGRDAPTLTGTSKQFLPKSVRGRLTDMKVIGEECFLTYRFTGRRFPQ